MVIKFLRKRMHARRENPGYAYDYESRPELNDSWHALPPV